MMTLNISTDTRSSNLTWWCTVRFMWPPQTTTFIWPPQTTRFMRPPQTTRFMWPPQTNIPTDTRSSNLTWCSRARLWCDMEVIISGRCSSKQVNSSHRWNNTLPQWDFWRSAVTQRERKMWTCNSSNSSRCQSVMDHPKMSVSQGPVNQYVSRSWINQSIRMSFMDKSFKMSVSHWPINEDASPSWANQSRCQPQTNQPRCQSVTDQSMMMPVSQWPVNQDVRQGPVNQDVNQPRTNQDVN